MGIISLVIYVKLFSLEKGGNLTRNAGEAKALKCLASGKGTTSLVMQAKLALSSVDKSTSLCKRSYLK